MDNYQTILYRQYLRRAPENLPALVTTSVVEKAKIEGRSPSQVETDGTPNQENDTDEATEVSEKIEWTALSLEQRLDVMHDVCEWQFTNPTRLRSNMKTDDEYATWVRYTPRRVFYIPDYVYRSGSNLWDMMAPKMLTTC